MGENFYQGNDVQHFSNNEAQGSQKVEAQPAVEETLVASDTQQRPLPAWMFREPPTYPSGFSTSSQAFRRLQVTLDEFDEPGSDVPLLKAMFMVLTHPSIDTFNEVKGHASWGLVWGLLLVFILVSTIASRFIANIDMNTLIIDALVALPLYFLVAGIQFAVARSLSYEKTGTFLEQCYATLLFGLPLSIMEPLVGSIPTGGKLISSVLSLYTLVLLVQAMKAIHDIGTFKSLLALLAPVGLAVVIALCFAVSTGVMSLH